MKTAFMVLGMHRSGTSSVAGVLARLDVRPPATLLPSAPDNPRGFWESRPVMELNERILWAGASFWRDWRAFDFPRVEAQAADFRREIAGVVRAEFGESPAIVVKDPRLCRLFPLWDRALAEAGYQARVIMPIRSPLEVAGSLARRNGVSVPDGLLLWLRHVLDAEFASRGRPRVFVAWDRFIQDWRGEVARMEQALDWPFPPQDAVRAAEIDAFLSADLRTQVVPDADLRGPGGAHEWVAAAYSALRNLSVDGASPAALGRLDRVRRAFERSCALHAPAHILALMDASQAHAARDQAQARARESEQAAADLETRLRDERARVGAERQVMQERTRTAADEARRRAELAQAEIVRLSDDLAARRADIQSLRAALADERARLERSEADRRLLLERSTALRDWTRRRPLASAWAALNGRLWDAEPGDRDEDSQAGSP